MGNWTIADVTGLVAGGTLVAVLTWASNARAQAHRWAAREAGRGEAVSACVNEASGRRWRIDVIRAARHVRRLHAGGFGGLT